MGSPKLSLFLSLSTSLVYLDSVLFPFYYIFSSWRSGNSTSAPPHPILPPTGAETAHLEFYTSQGPSDIQFAISICSRITCSVNTRFFSPFPPPLLKEGDRFHYFFVSARRQKLLKVTTCSVFDESLSSCRASRTEWERRLCWRLWLGADVGRMGTVIKVTAEARRGNARGDSWWTPRKAALGTPGGDSRAPPPI